MTGFPLYVNWTDLEPNPGRYTLDRFEATLSVLRQFGICTDFRNALARFGDGPIGIPELTCPTASSMGVVRSDGTPKPAWDVLLGPTD